MITEPVAPGRVQWATKTDLAYASLRARILDGSLPPGETIEQEALAADLGLSTTPIREALRRLEAEGWLRQLAHREIRVPALSRVELDELYAVRLELDPFAARLGARLASEADRGRARDLVAVTGGSPREQLVRNHELHRTMYLACGNSVLIELLDRLWERSDRYRIVLVSDQHTAHQADVEHQRLVEAFCAGDGEELRRVLRAHLDASHRTLSALID